ncbi:MAG: S-layer homology domain-containing protein [Candidatus Gracilibacteria bacterium]
MKKIFTAFILAAFAFTQVAQVEIVAAQSIYGTNSGSSTSSSSIYGTNSSSSIYGTNSGSSSNGSIYGTNSTSSTSSIYGTNGSSTSNGSIYGTNTGSSSNGSIYGTNTTSSTSSIYGTNGSSTSNGSIYGTNTTSSSNGSIYGTNSNTSGNIYGTNENYTGSIYGTNNNVNGSIYGTNGNSNGSIYGTNNNVNGSIYGTNGNTNGTCSIYGTNGNSNGCTVNNGDLPFFSNLSSTVVNSTAADVSWTSSNSSDFRVCYQVQYASIATCINVGNAASYRISGLTPATTYQWWVRGTNTTGSASSSVQYFTTNNANNGGNSLPNFGALNSSVNNDGSVILTYSATDTQNTTISYQICYKVTNTAGAYTCTNAGNATTFTLSGLLANTQYTWFVKATNNVGTRDSNTAAFTTTGTSNGNNTPHVTLLESRNIQATTATLIWNGYDADVNAPLTYTVCFGTTAGNITNNCSVTTSNESTTLTNLIAGTTYYWTVRVADQVVQGITDNGPLSFTTMANNSTNRMPSITLGSATNPTQNGATVNYSATDPDGNALTVDICISTDRNNAASNCVYTTTNTGSYTITNLAPGTTYYWTARVSDGTYMVYSTDQIASFTTTGTVTNQAPIARLVDATNVTATSATVRWIGTDNESDALTYQVCYSTSLAAINTNCVNYTTPNGASSNPANPTTLTFNLTGLSTNVPYFWNVQVRDASHGFTSSINGPFTFVTGTSTTLPSVTLNPVTSPVTTNTVNLSWNGTNAVSYDVYFGTTSSPVLYMSGVTGTQVTSPTLTNGTYYWNVIARNSNGQTATATNGPNSFSVNITNGTTNPPVTPVVTQNDTFRFTAYTASTTNGRAKTVFAANESIRFVMQVANISTQPQTLTFPDNGDEVRFNVNTSTGTQSFVAHADSTTNTSIVLAPGEVRTFTADTPSGTPTLVDGLYTATAQIRATNSNLPTAPQMQFLVSTTQSQVNYAPVVTLLTPSNNTVVNGGNVTLTWFGFDPNGDALLYDVYFDTNSNPTTLVTQGTSATNYQATGLANGTRYYWRVVARDPQGLTGQSLNGTFTFTTQTATQNPSANANFEYTLITRDGATNNPRTVFIQGQNMVFELQVRNLTQNTQTATINDASRALFRVMDANNQQVFISPSTSGNQSVTFNPGEVKTYNYTWNQAGTNGSQVALGNYILSGDINPTGSNIFPTAATTAFSIVASNNNPNLAPTVNLVSPSDNSNVSTTTTTLTWAGQDPNGNTLNYNVYVATSAANLTGTTPVATNLTTNSYSFTGTNNTRYYWTVRATDGSLPTFAANGPFSFFINTGGTTTTLGLTGNLLLKSTVTGADSVNFARTENVNVQVVVFNPTSTNQTLTFPTSQMFDVIIKNSAGQIVWQSSRGQNFTQGQTSIVVPGNGSVQLASITWNRTDNNGQLVPSGNYTAEAVVTSNNATITIPAKAFTINTSNSSTGGGGGGGGGSSGGGGGGGSQVDTTTPTTIPATDNGSFLTVYGPLKFDLSNGVATVPIKHMDAGNGISIQYDKGTIVTNPDGSRFTGTIYTPSCYTASRLPETAKTSIPNGYTQLYDCFIQYGDLTQTFSPMLRVYGDLSRDITRDVSQPENLAIMFYDPATKTWTKIGGYSDFKGKRFDTYIKKSGVIGFFDTHNTPGTSIPQQPQGTCSAFTDIQFHWAKDVICTLASRGVVSGVTGSLFRPDVNMTRAELVKLVMRLNGKAVAGIDASKAFPDIRGNEWYAGYIAQAKALGIINGYDDGFFRPNQPVNRAEALKIILRGTSGVLQAKIDQEQVIQSSDSDDYTFFQDVRETDWFSRYVAYSFKRGIVSGKNDGLFHGEHFATRAELSKIALMMYEFPNK